jgi:hypothetical protein
MNFFIPIGEALAKLSIKIKPPAPALALKAEIKAP